MPPSPSPSDATQDRRRQQLHAEQIRLLYSNTHAAIGVTVCVASVLSYLQWGVIAHSIVLAWLIYMWLISAARFALARRYRRAAPVLANTRAWGTAFTIGSGLSAVGWGAAGVLLYPETHLTNQVFLAFVLGGMMLGAGSVLAARPEAYLAFIIPAGVPIAVRFLFQGDELHVAMGLLATVFTVATLLTTCHIYQTVRASLNLQFENKDLVADLLNAKQQAEILNQELEVRVQERTTELRQANELLRAEIEQRKQVEEELLRARKLEALGVLAGGIAHDFNNFLTIVQGNLGLARLELEAEHPVREILDQTAAACQRAASLASQLLTFGKGGTPVRRTASVARLLRDAIDLARAGANVGFEVAIGDDLWPAEIDASQISHALQNILINARQAMPKGGIIEVRAENIILDSGSLTLSPGKYIRISVRDYGCGIPPGDLPRVFDPYFTTKRTGTGLGLTAAYAIVAKHQGRLTVQSTVGVETTFNIYLPASEQALPSEQPTDEVLHMGSGRVLAMDDDAALRKLLTQMLERLGYQVECASDGAEAIVLYEKAKTSARAFDLVLLDLTIPGGMGGIGAAAKLREIDASAKLIASSGYSDAPVMSEFQTYGFDDVIPKPWTPAQVSEVLQRVLLTNRARIKP
jgi:signal transduction histidine kinase/ActR/RegA family two-component response regulator